MDNSEKIQQIIQAEIKRVLPEFAHHSPEQIRNRIAEIVTRNVLQLNLNIYQRQDLIDEFYYATTGLDLLQPLLEDEAVTEIMVNSYNEIFTESRGEIHKLEKSFKNQEHLQNVVIGLFARANKELSLNHPIADLRLKDGSRANAVIPPIAPQGPVLTIRKFTGILPQPSELVRRKTINDEALIFLKRCVENKKSVFICGGTSAGKTTLLNALSHFISNEERIITIEDSIELQLADQPNLVKLEARQAHIDGRGEVSISTLVKTALRMRPDRIIIGEVRGDEAYMLIHAANTGHPGTLSTGHGNNCHDMLIRLANMISSCTTLPYSAIQRSLCSSLDYMVQIQKTPKGRRVTEIVQLDGFANDEIKLKSIFAYDETGDKLYAKS